MTPVSIVAYLALFVGVGALFLFSNLLLGWFLRPSDPHAEKLEVYECGEPAIGSSFVQFDLRFYVVALLFLIFDVEIAFFFPWATVYGKATHLMAEETLVGSEAVVAGKFAELGVPSPTMGEILTEPAASAAANAEAISAMASNLALMAIFDILVFFAVLMVGFFYVWRRGDLDWVRAVSEERARRAEPTATEEAPEEELVPA